MAAALAGCGDDWGNKIEAFVDNEVHGLTAEIADNELRVRWFDYFSGLTTKSILVIDAANKLTSTATISGSQVDTFEQREKLLELVETAAMNNLQAEQMLRSSEAELSGAKDICESTASSMHRVDVASLGSRIASSIALPKSEWYVEVSCQFGGGGQDSGSSEQKSGGSNGCWKSFVSIVSALFGADKQKEQEDKANAAIARIPNKVVSPSEVEVMSKNICKVTAQNQTLISNIDMAKAALQAARQNTKTIAKTLVEIRADLDVAQMPILLQKVRDGSGIERVATEISKEYEALFVTQSINSQRKDLAALEKRFGAAHSCGEVLAASEFYMRALTEKRRQLEAAVAIESVYKAQFDALLTVVKGAEAALPNQRTARLTAICVKQ
jgi:hypothetical protein